MDPFIPSCVYVSMHQALSRGQWNLGHFFSMQTRDRQLLSSALLHMRSLAA